MLLHTLEQTFQAGAVRSLGAYFFYILPFRLSFFACCCHVEILTYLFLAYCIQQEGKKLEMRRPVDIDAICLFWLTDSNARRLGASSPSRLARYTATMTVSNWHCLLVCYTNYRRTWTQQICMASAFYRRGGREALVIVRHSILPPIRLLLLLLLLKLLHAVSAVVEFHRRAETLDGTAWPQQALCQCWCTSWCWIWVVILLLHMGLSGSYGYVEYRSLLVPLFQHPHQIIVVMIPPRQTLVNSELRINNTRYTTGYISRDADTKSQSVDTSTVSN